MAKPRRRRIKVAVWTESDAGREFLRALIRAVGRDARCEPLRYDSAARAHLFRITGGVGSVDLAEEAARRRDGLVTWEARFAQTRESLGGPGIYTARLRLHRTEGDADERAQVGDALDRCEEAFTLTSHIEEDPAGTFPSEPAHVEIDLRPHEPERAMFSCAACPEPSGGAVHVPAGTPFEGLAPDEDAPETSRVGVWFHGTVDVYTELPGFEYFARARAAIREENPRALWSLFPGWAPFFCPVCDACYCADHWSGGHICPAGHERAADHADR